MLPRLPDTAEELTAIARALGVDPAKALNLGKDANERESRPSICRDYRIVAFATHGLVPGDLDGLAEPALALSAPEVAGRDGDGLLTMAEILALKLDADWVVLSACNTAAGAGAGAEAASGLGRLLLCRHARRSGHQLVGGFGLGARAGERPIPPPGCRSDAHAPRRAAGNDGATRRTGRSR